MSTPTGTVGLPMSDFERRLLDESLRGLPELQRNFQAYVEASRNLPSPVGIDPTFLSLLVEQEPPIPGLDSLTFGMGQALQYATPVDTPERPAPAVEPPAEEAPQDADSDRYELRWVLDLALAENDDLRRTKAAQHRRIRALEFEALMGWQTAPYHRLSPEDFGGMERQP